MVLLWQYTVEARDNCAHKRFLMHARAAATYIICAIFTRAKQENISKMSMHHAQLIVCVSRLFMYMYTHDTHDTTHETMYKKK